MIKETRIVDDTTGEVKYRQTQHIAAAFQEDKGYLFWARKSFAKSFLDIPYPESMTDIEIGRMARLAKKMLANTNMLGYRSNNRTRPMDAARIGKELGLKHRQSKKFVDKMIRLGMIAKVTVLTEKDKVIQYYINPIYFFSSNRIPLNLYLIFQVQLDRHLPEWVRDEFAKQSKASQ